MDCCKRLCKPACPGVLLRMPSHVSRKSKPLSGGGGEGDIWNGGHARVLPACNLEEVDRAARWAGLGEPQAPTVRVCGKACVWAQHYPSPSHKFNDRVRNKHEAGIKTRRNHASGFVLVSWLCWRPFTRGHCSATTLLFVAFEGRPGANTTPPLANIRAGRENHDHDLSWHKHTCKSQGRSPVLERTKYIWKYKLTLVCLGRPYKPLAPTPVTYSKKNKTNR
jgi:hypothetical protein